jgi:predicted amidohydrolase YtcJ
MPEAFTGDADLIVRGSVYTMDAARPAAEAFAVRDGKVAAVGDEADVMALAGPRTWVTHSGDGMVMPGIVDVHSHVGFGGQVAAWELRLPPAYGPYEILAAVTDWADGLGPDDWVVGGTVTSPVFHAMGTREMLSALDKASQGRPVMLRDDSLRNRWVNSRALEILGVDALSLDPVGGSYLRDGLGPVGLLFGQAGAGAELAARDSIRDWRLRDLRSARAAVKILNAAGITATQDAATMGAWLDAFCSLDRTGQLNAWIVGSMPAREFIESGRVGSTLFDTAPARRSAHVRPDFIKAVLDGVPMTRTSRLLGPYKRDSFAARGDSSGLGCPFHGSGLYTDEELDKVLEAALSRGLNVKLHATGDGTVRQALDGVKRMRERYGDGPIFHIAHPEFVHPDDVRRFAELGVIADASPALWFPGPLNALIGRHVPDHYMERIWPFAELRGAGALIAAGSDWPVAAPAPDPWLSLEAMVTRRGVDPAFPGTLARRQALSLDAAIAAHTVNAAWAAGLAKATGKLSPGMSADFIVLDRDLFTVPVDQIHATQVRETWFGGRLVHNASAGKPLW